MTKRTVEMDDTLDETIESIKEDCKNDFLDWFKEHPESDWDTYYQEHAVDAVHEIVDSATPIYNKEIDDLYYLYGDEFDRAYENAGIGNGDEPNHRQVTIYCYLEEQAWDYMSTLEDALNEWRDRDEEDKDKTIEDYL